VFMLRKQTSELAIKYGIAVVYPLREDVEEGGLISYGSNVADQFRQAAVVTNKILKGASASNIPVEQPTKFDLVINLKTAKAMGLALPNTLLLRADKLIE
jgi:putative ABC transport system substrate-binding protein